LQDRQIESAKVAAENAKNKEVGSFKAFVQNEYHRICAKLRSDIGIELQKQYEFHLKDNTPVDFVDLRKMLSAIKPDSLSKFSAAHLTTQDMMELFSAIPKPNYNEIYSSFDVESYFINIERDKKNADAAIKSTQDALKLQQIENDRILKTETALTNIIATSEIAEVAAPVIKTEMKIIDENTEAWMKTVAAKFILYLPHLSKYIRVKRWGALSIDQMGAYLAKHVTETGELITDLKFEKIQK